MKTGNRVVDDLVHHTHERCARIISDSADLLDEDDRLMFILAVLGHVMAEAANGVVDDPSPPGGRVRIKTGNMMVAAIVLMYLVDAEGLAKVDISKSIARSQRLVERLQAMS